MKKRQLPLLIGLLALIFGCNSANQNSSTSESSEIMQFALTANDVSQPSNLISIQEAKTQLNHYNTAHPGVVGDQYGLKIQISLEELENYIAYVRQESEKNQISVEGVEFIFTQHKEAKPKQDNVNNQDYELSFMIAPTYLEDGKAIAFDPLQSASGEPAKLSDLFNSATSDGEDEGDSSSKGGNKPTKSGIANHYNACPKNCD